MGVRDRVGVFERHLLRVAKERALSVVLEGLDLVRRDAEPAAHGSIDVLSELAAVPGGDATVEQRPERAGHALGLLLEDLKHRLRGAEIRRVARVEEVGMERRAPELALLLERVAQVVRERLDVDGRDPRLSCQHGHSSTFVWRCSAPDPTSEAVARAGAHFDGDRSVYGSPVRAPPGSEASMPKVFWRPRRPSGVTTTAWLRGTLSIQPRSKHRRVIAAPTAPAMCGRRSVQSRQSRQKRRRGDRGAGSSIPNSLRKRAPAAVTSATSCSGTIYSRAARESVRSTLRRPAKWS